MSTLHDQVISELFQLEQFHIFDSLGQRINLLTIRSLRAFLPSSAIRFLTVSIVITASLTVPNPSSIKPPLDHKPKIPFPNPNPPQIPLTSFNPSNLIFGHITTHLNRINNPIIPILTTMLIIHPNRQTIFVVVLT